MRRSESGEEDERSRAVHLDAAFASHLASKQRPCTVRAPRASFLQPHSPPEASDSRRRLPSTPAPHLYSTFPSPPFPPAAWLSRWRPSHFLLSGPPAAPFTRWPPRSRRVPDFLRDPRLLLVVVVVAVVLRRSKPIGVPRPLLLPRTDSHRRPRTLSPRDSRGAPHPRLARRRPARAPPSLGLCRPQAANHPRRQAHARLEQGAQGEAECVAVPLSAPVSSCLTATSTDAGSNDPSRPRLVPLVRRAEIGAPPVPRVPRRVPARAAPRGQGGQGGTGAGAAGLGGIERTRGCN